MLTTTPAASLHPCTWPATAAYRSCICRPAFSLGARSASSTPVVTSTSKPIKVSIQRSLMQELGGRISVRIDEAAKAARSAPRRLLDELVDAAFKFTDQPLHPSESNFAPVDEVSGRIEILQIEGEIPEDFPEGVYIRNGSNPHHGALQSAVSIFGESREIWVEGEGMLHALYFTRNSNSSGTGQAWAVAYANRYVQSETLEIERHRKKPCFLPAIEGGSVAIVAAYILNYLRFGKVNKDISNTNVFEHAGRVYAVAESHLPREICIQSLETGKTWDIGGEWDRPFTAHPKVAPGSGELVIFGSDAKKPFLVVGVVSDDGTKLKHRVDLKLDRCTLCHDIGVTPKYNIIMDVPLTIDIGRLIRGGPLIEFEKESYARIGIMPRYGDAESVMWFDVEPLCMFHLINCFEEDDEVVVVRGFRAADSIIPGTRFGPNKYDMNLGRSESKGDNKMVKQAINQNLFSRLYEWRLNLKTRTVSGAYLTGTEWSMEFPMINNDYTGIRHSYAYAQIVDSISRSSDSSGKVNPKYRGFAKLCLQERDDVVTETTEEHPIKMEYHRLQEDHFCSGAAFVPRVGGSHEDDGWIVSFVHNERANTSQVHIVDTQLFESAPVAKVTLPRRVPYGFHGTFIRSDPMSRHRLLLLHRAAQVTRHGPDVPASPQGFSTEASGLPE